jgi:hypothetical protein
MLRTLLFISSVLLLAACMVAKLAPGAESIRITDKGADVATCKAVGNIQVPKNEQGVVDMASAQTQFRNQAVGFGGHAGLVTEGFLKYPVAGMKTSLCFTLRKTPCSPAPAPNSPPVHFRLVGRDGRIGPTGGQ